MLRILRRPVTLLRRSLNGRHLVSAYSTWNGQNSLESLLLKTAREASVEQAAIVTDLRSNNVVVSARPGSGKTATAEFLARRYPNSSLSVVTYSKRLQVETEARLREFAQVDTYTFHALAGRMFNRIVNTDSLLRQLRTEQLLPSMTRIPRSCDLLVLDEVQDMTEELYWTADLFIKLVTRLQGYAPRILALGDERQALYDFRGADSRFLKYAPSLLLDGRPHTWFTKVLSKSFRLTHENAYLINNAFLGGEQYIESVSGNGRKPIYAHVDKMATGKLASFLLPLIEEYGPENSVILAPSIRKSTPIKRLANVLCQLHGIPIAASISDGVALDSDVTRGKLVLSTYHQFKGSERDLAIVFGADNAYFRHIARGLPDDRCPNTTFVALTRARQQLVIIQALGQAPMPFMNMGVVEEACVVKDLIAPAVPSTQKPPGRPPFKGLQLPPCVEVTELVRYTRDKDLDELIDLYIRIDRRWSLPPQRFINAPEKICTDPVLERYEAVADLNGIAVMAAIEWRLKGTLKSLNMDQVPEVPEGTYDRIVWFTRQAAEYDAEVSEYRPRLVQMQDHPFDWLVDVLDVATARMRTKLVHERPLGSSSWLQFKKFYRHAVELGGAVSGADKHQGTTVTGYIDILETIRNGEGGQTTTRIWELKFVSQLTLNHAAQAVILSYLWATQPSNREKPFPEIILFNIRDGATWRLHTTFDEAKAFLEGALRARYTIRDEVPLDKFLASCEGVRREVDSIVSWWDTPQLKAHPLEDEGVSADGVPLSAQMHRKGMDDPERRSTDAISPTANSLDREKEQLSHPRNMP